MDVNIWFRDREWRLGYYSDWKTGQGMFRHKGYYESEDYCFLIYDTDNNIRAYVTLDRTTYNSTTHNNHAKLTFEQFKQISALNPERWIVLNHNTVAVIAEDIAKREVHTNGKMDFSTDDILFCYDITDFKAGKKLYQFEQQRLNRALSLDNNKTPGAAIEYLVKMAQDAISEKVESSQKEIATAEAEYQKVLEKMKKST